MKVFAIALLAFVALFEISSADNTEWKIEGGHGYPTTPRPCSSLYEGLTQQQVAEMQKIYSEMAKRGLSRRPECHALPNEGNN